MNRVLMLLLCLLSVTAGALIVPPAATDAAATARRGWVPVGAGRAASLLRVPPSCSGAGCGLVVVSHPRGQTPEHLRASPQASVLTDALLRAGFAVLLSSDGGPSTWGSPADLTALGVTHATATRQFMWNGHTYALGLSMGGLMALRSALPGAPYPVEGVALIDAWVDVDLAYRSAASRRQEIEEAYNRVSAPEADLNPRWLVAHAGTLPLLVVGSRDDRTVPFGLNGEALYSQAALPGLGGLMQLSGPHLGGNRFTPGVAERLVTFYRALAAVCPAGAPAPCTAGPGARGR
ncbi:alpha/beta hydrolase [Deinococcus taeanensis]|uniref:alpha/beta hydrolase n=1 Tax=Deinococcus taeanensis TaxID=2737050 RepID=UPI001CDC4D7A|nr:alpha/beta hydrolase [Deinococcus taeanensis]UBV43737.1 alpha/beta hydrolase [Deinococcus taeanensis]